MSKLKYLLFSHLRKCFFNIVNALTQTKKKQQILIGNKCVLIMQN